VTRRPETLDDLTPRERALILAFLKDYPSVSPEEAIKEFLEQGM
jgi:hypothetical protein